MEGECRLEMSYYNEKLAIWEPLLEPIMESRNNYRPWEVTVKVSNSRMFVSCVNKVKHHHSMNSNIM